MTELSLARSRWSVIAAAALFSTGGAAIKGTALSAFQVAGFRSAVAALALGAKVARPDSEVWILYGDGSVAYSLMEFDTFARHGIPVIALVGNDASWAQIARDQVAVLGDDVGTVLASTDYELAAEALGGKGLAIGHPDEIAPAFAQARVWARAGHPVLLNARLTRSEFRKGSISL